MHPRSRAAAALVALGAAAGLTVACAAVLGVDDVTYGMGVDGAVDDASDDAREGGAADAAAGDATTGGCGPNTKICIVCVPERSVPTGCNPKSCDSCRVGPHADAACAGTQCVIGACQAPFLNCDGIPANGCEVDPQRGDPANCGGCGRACDAGLLCQPDGGCALVCDPPRVACDGGCVDTTADPQNCLGCGRVCPGYGAQQISVRCSALGCQSECSAGFTDCNGDPTDGCECGPDSTCAGGVCSGCTPFLQSGCTLAGCCVYPYAMPTCNADQCCVPAGQYCGHDGWCCSGSCNGSSVCN